MNQTPPDGPQPMGRTASRIFVIALLVITIALALWSAFFLIRTARESGESESIAPDTTSTSAAIVHVHPLPSHVPLIA